MDKELKEIKLTEIKAVNCSLKKADYKTVLHHFGVKEKSMRTHTCTEKDLQG